MRRSIVRWLWRLLLPVLSEWLSSRALRLPQAQRERLARQLHLDPTVIEAVEQALREFVLRELQEWQP
jgi:seryl-tRNA(Sec) selenium transferase